MVTRPYRAILNFAHRCAMRCEWCYVPFDSGAPQEDTVTRVVERLVQLGFRQITFGGGDPFQYKFIVGTLARARSLGAFVHVDTHGLAFERSVRDYVKIVAENIDLLGLPLDGSNEYLHDSMRSAPGHHKHILRVLDALSPVKAKVKINSLVGAKNQEDLSNLAHLIRNISPSRWSIYQYWPLGPARSVASKHATSVEDFRATALLASSQVDTTTVVEINDRESRQDTYPIVQHDGEVSVHDPASLNNFRRLGTVFDEGILSKIQAICHSDRQQALTRYR